MTRQDAPDNLATSSTMSAKIEKVAKEEAKRVAELAQEAALSRAWLYPIKVPLCAYL